MPTLPRHVLPTDDFGEAIADLATREGWDRIGVITGDSFEQSTGFSDRLTAAAVSSVRRWSRGPAHCPVDNIELLTSSVADFRPDVLVTAGGGSSHDAGKGVAALLALGGPLHEHCIEFNPPDDLRFKALPGEKIPLITVPSTLSGSEANGAAGFTVTGSKGKRVLSDVSLVPQAVILDPRLTDGCPPEVFLGSAMNALNHCIEGMASRRQNATSDFLLPSSLRVLSGLEPSDGGRLPPESVSVALTASVMAGIGLAGTWLGIAHAIGHVLGATYGVPHGACHAVMAGACIRFNATEVPEAHRRAAEVVGLDHGSDALADWMDERAASFGLPGRLRDLGVNETDLEELAEWVWRDHDTYFNPRRPRNPSEIVELLAGSM